VAARNRTQPQLRQIEDAFAAMATATTIAQWVDADLGFHSAILDATNNPLLRPLAAMIGSALESLLGLSARKAGDFKVALPEHGAVLDAIRAQDSSAATQRMSLLLADTRARLVRPGGAPARKRLPDTAARRMAAR
jgi:DNA-binding FadR family transcriptional regulator